MKRGRAESAQKLYPFCSEAREKLQRTKEGSGLVECPLCFRQVPLAGVNLHLDTQHSDKPAKAQQRAQPPGRIGELEHVFREAGGSSAARREPGGNALLEQDLPPCAAPGREDSLNAVEDVADRWLATGDLSDAVEVKQGPSCDARTRRQRRGSGTVAGQDKGAEDISTLTSNTPLHHQPSTGLQQASLPSQQAASAAQNARDVQDPAPLHDCIPAVSSEHTLITHFQLADGEGRQEPKRSTVREDGLLLQPVVNGSPASNSKSQKASTFQEQPQQASNCGEQACSSNTGQAVRIPQEPHVQQQQPGDTGEQSGSCSTKNKEAGSAAPNSVVQATVAKLMQSSARQRLAGQFLFERFVSEGEENELVAMIDRVAPPWKNSTFNGRHRGKAWGVRMDLARRVVIPETHPLPPLLQNLAARMRTLPPLRTFFPTEANAIEYDVAQGHYLGAHVDNRQLSTGAIVTLSLISRCVMTFERDGKAQGKSVRITLPPGSLQVITGEARYSYKHGIARPDFQGARRISVTFRQSPLRR